jgi:lipoyl-dependent peroxiredoxin
MPVRKSSAVWEGNLMEGKGTMKLGSGAFTGQYSFASRFQDGKPGTNPEELAAAAHAGCFSMALSHALSEAGHPPTRVATTAVVHLEKADDGFHIPRIELETEADVPGIDERQFHTVAEEAKRNCPISRLYQGAKISLTANLLSGQRR